MTHKRHNSSDTPLFLERIREKRKNQEENKKNEELYKHNSYVRKYYRRDYALKLCLLFLVFTVLVSVVFIFANGINEHKIDSHANNDLMVKYIVENYQDTNTAMASIEKGCDKECPNLENEKGIFSGLSTVLWKKMFFDESEEKKSLLDDAISNFISGFSSKAGSASFDSVVNFFNNTKFSNKDLIIVYFNKNNFSLTRSGIDKINDLCVSLKKRKGPIVILGHTDSTGGKSYNQVLADNRMKTVRDKIKDSCQGYIGEFKLVNNVNAPTVSTTSDYSEPENRVVVVEY